MNKSDLKLINFPLTRDCFGCSPTNPIGLQLEFYTQDSSEKLYSFFTPNNKHVSWGQIIHGGISATILDEMSGWVVIMKKKHMCVTLSLDLKYHASLNINTEYVISGEIRTEKGRLIEVNSKICNQEGKVFVSSVAKLLTLNDSKAKSLKIMHEDDFQLFNDFLNE